VDGEGFLNCVEVREHLERFLDFSISNRRMACSQMSVSSGKDKMSVQEYGFEGRLCDDRPSGHDIDHFRGAWKLLAAKLLEVTGLSKTSPKSNCFAPEAIQVCRARYI
jgi:hypothetical protein